MTTIDVAPTGPGARRRGRAPGLLAFLGRLAGRLDATEDRRELHALSDHMLSDLGLMRDQIDEALRTSAQRQRDRLRRHGG